MNHKKGSTTNKFALVLTIIFGYLATYSQASFLDPTFGHAGVASVAVGDTFVANVTALYPDGRILLAGTSHSGNAFKLIRFDHNGLPDSTFGVNGIVTTSDFNNNVKKVVIDHENKILFMHQSGNSISITRLNVNGSIDSSFGGAIGGLEITLPFYYDYPQFNFDFLSKPDSSILVFGSTFSTLGNDNNTVFIDTVFSYTKYGLLDTSFHCGYRSSQYYGSILTLAPNGKITIAGNTKQYNANLYNGIFVARFKANGNIDSTFGTNGFTTNLDSSQLNPFSPSIASHGADVSSLEVQSDNKILLSGVLGGPGYSDEFFAGFIIRIDSNGRFDNSFGFNGKVFDTLINGYLQLAIEPSGKIIILTGDSVACQSVFCNNSAILMRLNSDGSRDSTFVPGGAILVGRSDTAFIPNTNFCLQNDGKILIGGPPSSYYYPANPFVMRFISNANATGLWQPGLINPSIAIYPNPATNSLTIESTEHNLPFVLTDLLGNTLVKGVVENGSRIVDVSNLSAGMYFINNRKFIKQ